MQAADFATMDTEGQDEDPALEEGAGGDAAAGSEANGRVQKNKAAHMLQISSIRVQLFEVARASAEAGAGKWEKAKTNVVVARLLAVLRALQGELQKLVIYPNELHRGAASRRVLERGLANKPYLQALKSAVTLVQVGLHSMCVY